MDLNKIGTLGSTRAEELDDDIWGQFFIPPYFPALKIRDRTRPIRVRGGRGCGKTMLLKYLHYETTFSTKRDKIPDGELEHIGIYWRIDTQFCNALFRRGLTEDQWSDAFEHYVAIALSHEFLLALDRIAGSTSSALEPEDLAVVNWDVPSDYDVTYPCGHGELKRELLRSMRRFEFWTKNISEEVKPRFIPGKRYLDDLVSEISEKIGKLKNARFYVYLDEFENLVEYQVRVINGYIKHSQKPLIFNVAMKSGALTTTETSGPESISGSHDYDDINIEELIAGTSKNRFFAEVVLGNLRLAENGPDDLLVQKLIDPSAVKEREKISYITEIVKEAKSVFPSFSYKEIAASAVREPAIFRTLEERIDKALELTGEASAQSSDYLSFEDVPEALVCLPVLLSRPKNSPSMVLGELGKYAAKRPSRFKSGSWIENHLVGSLLELYRPYARRCPVFAGFDTYCVLSTGNLRHFLALSYKTIECAARAGTATRPYSVEIQAQAAFETSSKFLAEVRTFGPSGERLRGFLMRLGTLFRAMQAAPRMSEPEQNQIAVTGGPQELADETIQFLQEALKHSVLIEQMGNKNKSVSAAETSDYQINPIYTPYFNISYRRKRKITLRSQDFETLVAGGADAYKALLADITKVTPDVSDPSASQKRLF